MNFEALQRSYWDAQAVRVEKLRKKIADGSPPSAGRVVPEDDDLAIGDGKRLDLAVMFLDISGFSGRASNAPAEQAMMLRVLNLFFTEMMKIAEDYDGVVEKNTGDGLMAYFENSADVVATTRAVTCAMTMFRANERLINPILRATPVTPIDFRISIDYGAVTIARLGAAKRFNQYVAIGATANFASKMLAHAKPGEIVLGEDAVQQLPVVEQILRTEVATTATGWTRQPAGSSYPLYRYTSRWGEFPA